MNGSRHVNMGRMYVRLISEPFVAVDCFKYIGSQMAADGYLDRDGEHKMNDEYNEWGAMKSLLSNRGALD